MVTLVRLIVSFLFSAGSCLLGAIVLGLLERGYYLGSFLLFSMVVGLTFVSFTALEHKNDE